MFISTAFHKNAQVLLLLLSLSDITDFAKRTKFFLQHKLIIT